ncbi:PKD domain-containing protein [Marinifilum flexuosum]|uniref:PKD domain-containing protein n=1 Tax=Marinifilum flexuosum TaxID=1117708 RepID=A0A419X8V0_9BACT|nr:PKD domain-containing protein [Marinifilum flexuosum]RKE04135.1 PKD domain-containing protein [Marinifilum flexuosum]
MKNLIYLIALLVAVVSCSPDEYSAPANLTADQIEWEYFETDVVNEFTLINKTEGVTTLWDLGNGTTAKGDTVTARYTFAGTYTVKLTVINQGGTVEVQDNIVTDRDNMAFLSGYPYDQLIGEGTQTWAIDAYYKGHFGLGPTIENPVEWYGANPGEKADRGLYDDRFTFEITESGLTVTQVTNGDVYANGGWAADLGTTAGNEEPDGGDFIMPFDGGEFVCSFAGDILTVNGGGFLGYYAGANEYQILALEDDLLDVVFWDTKANFYWFTRFRPLDKLTPEPVEEPKELLALDIMDDFEGNGNIQWSTSDIDKFAVIDNFAPVPINESEKIAIYQKGAGEWTNVKAVLTHYMDLTERNVFSMKVFIPSFNDYETECNPGTDWLATHNLMPQVDVKLQDSSLGGNAWTTQQVRTHVLTSDQQDMWVELTFDFSDVTDRVDFDQIIIQLGNEGHCNSGIFYIDDFELL